MSISTQSQDDPQRVANIRGYGAQLLLAGATIPAIVEPMARHARALGLSDSELTAALNNLEELQGEC